jgi:hypothetical protein
MYQKSGCASWHKQVANTGKVFRSIEYIHMHLSAALAICLCYKKADLIGKG